MPRSRYSIGLDHIVAGDEGWYAAVAGSEYVLHIAAPVGVEAPHDPNVLIVPTRDGALRVLRAACRAKVERVFCAPRSAHAEWRFAQSPRIGFCVVDIRDVVDLPIRAMTAPGSRRPPIHCGKRLGVDGRCRRPSYGPRWVIARKVPTKDDAGLRAPERRAVQPSNEVRCTAPGLKARLTSAKAEAMLGWKPRSAEKSYRRFNEAQGGL